jgi:hypothetical protein
MRLWEKNVDCRPVGLAAWRKRLLMVVPFVGLLAAATISLPRAEAAQDQTPTVPTQTTMVDGQPVFFPTPPGYCLLPQNSPYAGMFYGGGAAAGAVAAQSVSNLNTLAAFLPCDQVRDPQASPVVAYQSWAVTTRYGSVLHLAPQDSPSEILAAMYELTQGEDYRRAENTGLEAVSHSLNSSLLLDQRQDASGLRSTYFYRAYSVPVQGGGTVSHICAATAFAVVKGMLIRSEQLSPCSLGQDKAASMQALVGEVTGQLEYFLALNGQVTQ